MSQLWVMGLEEEFGAEEKLDWFKEFFNIKEFAIVKVAENMSRCLRLDNELRKDMRYIHSDSVP